MDGFVATHFFGWWLKVSQIFGPWREKILLCCKQITKAHIERSGSVINCLTQD